MLPAIAAGDMPDRIRLWQPANVVNEFNETTESFQAVAEVWAEVEPLSGRELVQAQAVREDVQIRVKFRYFSGFDHTWRIQVLTGPKVTPQAPQAGKPLNSDPGQEVVWVKDERSRQIVLEAYLAGFGAQRAAAPGA